ncbi:membrane fusion protein, multidrug efflux system [Paracoccus halophilus]|uniref:Membrane fusion protein, multidrug efflux system n=1 Tax=Paracoccus halophilus TaxID=376733 RepID=A0A1I0U9N6_9RHOB|nr:efflux RND transporter periplasmic adaptor subunit [Paracoccus halophilus]SFA60809.1 membrane fusion protein, multidrug efflux system [Paracoccus halophilus]
MFLFKNAVADRDRGRRAQLHPSRGKLAIAIAFSAVAMLTANPAAAQTAPAVVVAAAEMRDLRQAATFTGRVISLQKIDVIARVPGYVEEIGFTEGELVEQGSTLFLIEDDAYVSSVQQAEAAIKAAEAALRLAEIEKDRRSQLVQRNAVAQSELDFATASYDEAAAQLAARVAQKADADLNLSYTRIEAPFAGIVGLSVPDVGALVGPQSGALTTLTSLDPISVEFPVASSIYLNYRKQVEATGGRPADVTITLPNGDVFDQKGRIDFVSSQVDTSTDTVRIRALFDNPEKRLLDGALVRVGLTGSEPEMALSVPTQALQRDQLGYYVLVVDGEAKVEQRRVDVAHSVEGFSVISGGLETGEQVITEGQNKVRPGITVDAALAAEG